MNYKLKESSGKFQVYETSTEQVIKTFSTKTEARSFMKRLNLGAGFDGWSPTFILRDVLALTK